ncbi:MAG: hypothetical protein IPJ81_16165 [Chitinophagaceae bacterium]|nr:hypothetical protein [Chitinophagaceae bacterium]
MAKADKLEVTKRVRQIMEWMLEGHLTNDIIKSCTSKWAIDERMAYKYIKKAKALFIEITAGELKERLAFHIASRMKIFTGIKDKEKPAVPRAALDVLKDIADLEGYYQQKVDITSKGNPIHSQTIEATLTLK